MNAYLYLVHGAIKRFREKTGWTEASIFTGPVEFLRRILQKIITQIAIYMHTTTHIPFGEAEEVELIDC